MQLAQLNIGKPKFPLDHPGIADFMDNLVLINGIAEQSPGFIWRLKDESGDATSIQSFDDPDILVNMSVWESIHALKQFMFKSNHVDFLKRRSEWFHKMPQSAYVMWWIEDGHIPSVTEAKQKLTYLHTHGESADAFTMAGRFEAKISES